MGFSDANYHFPQAENLSINSKTVSESDRPADQDILESIQAAYFSINPNFDICRFELEVSYNKTKKLHTVLTSKEVFKTKKSTVGVIFC